MARRKTRRHSAPDMPVRFFQLPDEQPVAALSLADFIERSQKHNLAVNLDPANFLLYGTGDPVRAVSALRERIMHVHAKDAVASANPGIDWGTEQPLGAGEANIPRVISKLRAGRYSGPITIECDAGNNRTNRIREGLAYLRSMIERG